MDTFDILTSYVEVRICVSTVQGCCILKGGAVWLRLYAVVTRVFDFRSGVVVFAGRDEGKVFLGEAMKRQKVRVGAKP